jgi:hypothetical protein
MKRALKPSRMDDDPICMLTCRINKKELILKDYRNSNKALRCTFSVKVFMEVMRSFKNNVHAM